ncbi:MAG: hypothetical protein LIP09_00970 [Bacteroidales bacterium]|nr:hypothetical protein [Bacteroidales bacterium]
MKQRKKPNRSVLKAASNYLSIEPWEECKPDVSNSYPSADIDKEYSYVFEDGEWMMYKWDGDQAPLCNIC